jgi:molecular chaperone Hsp33
VKNYLVRCISQRGDVLGLACVTTGIVNEACRLHGTYVTASAALGRTLTGGALMGALLKNDQRLALKFEGNGPLKKIIVEADNEGNLRGFIGVPEIDLPLNEGKIDVAGALGRAGFLTVMKDLGFEEPYRGIVQLRTSEIAEDLAYYFTESEQIPSAVGLGVFIEPDGSVSAAGGFLIQSLPPSNEEVVDTVIQHIDNMPALSSFFRSGKTPEELLELLFEGIPFHILEKRNLTYRCTCNREIIKRVLMSLGRDEIESIARELGETEIFCEFCRTAYHFSRKELDHLIKEIEQKSGT